MCSESTFIELGLNDVIVKYCQHRGWNNPTRIQINAIPKALSGSDIVGISETGSGKTAAFLLPIFQMWMNQEKPKFFCLIISPTRELTKQIQFEIQLFSEFLSSKKLDPFNSTCLIGGEDMVEQTIELAFNKSHAIIGNFLSYKRLASPGRLVDHINNNARFTQNYFSKLKHLVLDEADQILNMQFQDDLDKILSFFEKPLSKKKIKRENYKKLLQKNVENVKDLKMGKNYADLYPHPQTYLFSATMTKRIEKLKRACISFENVSYVSGIIMEEKDSMKEDMFKELKMVGIPKNLSQYFVPCEILDKIAVLNHIIKFYYKKDGIFKNVVVFCNRVSETVRISAFLNQKYGDIVVHLTGKSNQKMRTAAINKFRENLFRESGSILVATDVAGRGLDFPNIGLVINYEVPSGEKSYKHRVGRTARAETEGIAITLVTKNVAVSFLDLEASIARVMPDNWKMSEWTNWKGVVADRKYFKKLKQLCNEMWQKANKQLRDKEKELFMYRREIDLNGGNLVDTETGLDIPKAGLDSETSSDELETPNESDDDICVGVIEAKKRYREMRREIRENRKRKMKLVTEDQEKLDDESYDEEIARIEENVPKKVARLISNK